MSLEHMIAAMSCMISTCGDNFTPTLLKNSIIANPLDDVWNGMCRKQASEFDQKFSQLLKSQQKAFNTLDSIEKSLNNLRTLATQSGDEKKVNKREECYYYYKLNLLAGPKFDCEGPFTGIPEKYEHKYEQRENEYLSFEVECQNINYGSNWLLIALMRFTRSENDFKQGFSLLWNSNGFFLTQYFIGSQALYPLINSNAIKEVLIVLYDNEYGIKDVISSEWLNDNEHSKKRSQLLNDFKGFDIKALCQVAFADILAYEEVQLVHTPRFAIFVKGNF